MESINKCWMYKEGAKMSSALKKVNTKRTLFNIKCDFKKACDIFKYEPNNARTRKELKKTCHKILKLYTPKFTSLRCYKDGDLIMLSFTVDKNGKIV